MSRESTDAARIAARREDLAWMAEHGENTSGAAARLGITRNALEVWCARHARDVWRSLARRDPVSLHDQRKAC